MTTEEMLALAVLRKDEEAILPLLDELNGIYLKGGRKVLPVKMLEALHVGRDEELRALAFARDSVEEIHTEAMERVVSSLGDWLKGGTKTLLLAGLDRVEVYRFKKEGK